MPGDGLDFGCSSPTPSSGNSEALGMVPLERRVGTANLRQGKDGQSSITKAILQTLRLSHLQNEILPRGILLSQMRLHSMSWES